MRASGILMPVFSLPSKYGIGCFSKEAYDFVDFLAEAGQKYWQILPLGPTSYGDSPYQSFSTFAGNPYFIDLEKLIERKWLTKAEVSKAKFGDNPVDIDYSALYSERYPILRKAFEKSNIEKEAAFIDFCNENAYWVNDYAIFMALKDYFEGVSFDNWPEDIRLRYDNALHYYGTMLAREILFYKFLQYEFYEQWMALKKYANEKGIKIIGDIPIYVAYDSADVWANPHLFQMDEEGRPTKVAGCPPDGFSATGQLWGNPVYNWPVHEQSGFSWWLTRIGKVSELYDVVRIDHFRGFDEYYAIPAKDEDAMNGAWEKGPGMKLFSTIKSVHPNTEIIAEDLGYITESVKQLVRDSGYPNMKVLEFAFDSRDSSGPALYLPYAYESNCVVYTGTHDNETLAGWLGNIKPAEVKMVKEYVGFPEMPTEEIPNALIRLAHASVAKTCIIPLTDYLGLGDEARINFPSTIGTNWRWRATSKQITKALGKKIYKLTKTYGRL